MTASAGRTGQHVLETSADDIAQPGWGPRQPRAVPAAGDVLPPYTVVGIAPSFMRPH